MKKIYLYAGSLEIIKDNKIFPNFLHDFIPRNTDGVWNAFRNSKVTSILSRFIDDGSWDNEEYERQIQLAVRDIVESARPRIHPNDAQDLVMWTISSFGKELTTMNMVANSEREAVLGSQVPTQNSSDDLASDRASKASSENMELSKHEKMMNVLRLLEALIGAKNDKATIHKNVVKPMPPTISPPPPSNSTPKRPPNNTPKLSAEEMQNGLFYLNGRLYRKNKRLDT